jgi:hypothetical protein
MITLQRTRLNGVKQTYSIYEAGDIVPPDIRLVSYKNRWTAMKGEYVEDINGRFIPLLRRICINKNLNHHNMIFPGFTWQPWRNDLFSYPIDKASADNVPVGLRGKDILIAKLIEEGLDAEQCVRRAYPGWGRRQVMAYLMRMFANPVFLRYLFVELGYVKKLKKALENRGISVDSIADQIGDLISDEKAVPTLRKWALETALAALESQDKTGSVTQIGEGDKDLDEFMQHLMPIQATVAELPEPLKHLPSISTES